MIEPRRATKDDWEEFAEMWAEMLNETIRDGGGDILPTEHSMDSFKFFFDAYDSGSLVGIAMIAPGAGVLMWGQAAQSMPFDSTNDPYAVGWGTFVRFNHRGTGLSRIMREYASEFLLASGFATLVGSVSPSNEAGMESVGALGFKHAQTQVVWHLRDEDDSE